MEGERKLSLPWRGVAPNPLTGARTAPERSNRAPARDPELGDARPPCSTLRGANPVDRLRVAKPTAPVGPPEARETRLLRAVVGELHLDTQVLLPEELDHRLEVVPVLAEHADLVLLDLRLDLELRVLDEAHDLLRLLHRDPLLDVDPLAHGATRRGLDLAVAERLERHAPAVELRLEDVEHLLQDVVVVRVDRDRALVEAQLGLRLLEVVARLHVARRLVDRVGDRLRIDLARDVEGVVALGHQSPPGGVTAGRRRRPAGARRRTARRPARSSPPSPRTARSRCSPARRGR